MRAVFIGVAGLALSLAALAFLHHELPPFAALVIWTLACATTLAVRRGWADLPPFVTGWLDAGVLAVAILAIAGSTGLTRGLPYAVLRWTRTLALFSTATLVGSVVGGLAYTHRRLEIEVREAARHLADARRRAVESRFTALSAQINPHFLFNTLNTLAEVVHEDEDQAEDLISDLASMMRYALDASSTRVALSEELDMVRRLLRIEDARLGERLTSTVVCDPAAREARIPGLLVQPLVENAVQHGVAKRIEGGEVRVEVAVDTDRVHIRVSDDGPGLPEAVRESLDQRVADDVHPGGLRNVAERVRLAWSDARFHVDSGTSGTTITLDLPLETQ